MVPGQPSSTLHYIFGGIWTMLGLIVLALLMLACSHFQDWLKNNNEGAGAERGETGNSNNEETILVIIAGEKRPTFLATPVSIEASSTGV
ncbi:hypothetical protein PTKIN_Ptkin11bG0131400 [Pterospermum kingtungense]